MPTLQEVLDLVASVNAGRRRSDQVGVYPETKHPTYFDSIGLSLEEPLVAALEANGYDRPNDAVFVQSFETANLRELDGMTRVRLVQLYSGSGQPYDFTAAGDPRTYADLATPAGLAEVATYADGIGPPKGMVVPVAADGTLGAPTSLVADAHRQGLTVHIYTMRNENSFVPPALRTSADPAQRGQVEAEYRRHVGGGYRRPVLRQPGHGGGHPGRPPGAPLTPTPGRARAAARRPGPRDLRRAGQARVGVEDLGVGQAAPAGGRVGVGAGEDALDRHLQLLARQRAGHARDLVDLVGHVAGRQLACAAPAAMRASQVVVEHGTLGGRHEQQQAPGPPSASSRWTTRLSATSGSASTTE